MQLDNHGVEAKLRVISVQLSNVFNKMRKQFAKIMDMT